MSSLAHIVNPVAVPATSDLRVAQPVTYESMRVAKWMAGDQVPVRQFVTHYPEDQEAVPEDFEPAGLLERSVLDLGTFAEPRKLPLLRDILDRLYGASEGADYMIYTNVDIALMPSFYLTVGRLIDEGYDAFVINRRVIDDRYSDPADLALMCAQAGTKHPGFDCFVFRRDAYPSYHLGNVCVGAPMIGRVLLLNVVAFGGRFAEFKDLHSTFHIGDDHPWRADRFVDQARFNWAEAEVVADTLERQFEPLDSDGDLARYLKNVRRRLEVASGARPKRSEMPTSRIGRIGAKAKRAWRRLRMSSR